jgi:hypothetical protein
LWGDFTFTLDGISFKIYNSVKELPKLWDIVAQSNVFLQTPYLSVLERSAPVNMECFYIGIFENSELIGVSLAQYLDLNKLESFGERDKSLKIAIRNFIFKNFASHTLFLGNNMITGQNSYVFSKEIDFNHISDILLQSTDEITLYFKKKGISIHLVSFKDFYNHCSVELKKYHFSTMYEFNTQPNMIFYLDQNWKSFNEYVSALTKKYRDQFKRARKKFEGIQVFIRGFGTILNELKELVISQNLTNKVFFLEPVDTQLLSEVGKDYDFGATMGRMNVANHLYATGFKTFENLSAGLALILPESYPLKKLNQEYKVGITYSDATVEELERVFEYILHHKEEIMIWKKNVRSAYHQEYNPARQKEKLIQKINQLIHA